MLAVVVCALALTLGYPLRAYLDQRGQIAGLRAKERATRASVAALTRVHGQWSDPAYVAAQARQRLHFVSGPGDRMLVLLRRPAVGSPTGAPVAALPPPTTWYGRLWRSVVAAGDEPPAPKPSRPAPLRRPGASPPPVTPGAVASPQR